LVENVNLDIDFSEKFLAMQLIPLKERSSLQKKTDSNVESAS
jgi:hypothetical protein